MMPRISPTERELMERLARGETHAAIADRMGYSPTWPPTISARIRKRFGCQTNAELVAVLVRDGLISAKAQAQA